MKKVVLTALALVLLFAGSASAVQEISFATVDWEPYGGEYLPEYGFTSAIIAEACNRVGLKATFHFMPWKRAMGEVRRGKYDALYSAYYSEERAKEFGVSNPYVHGPLVLCAKKGTSISWDGTMRSLEAYRIGVVRGYVNTPVFDKSEFLIKDETTSDLLNLRKLLGGRIDIIVIDKFLAIHMLKTNPTLEGDLQDVQFLSPPLEEKDVHVMFSKSNPGWKRTLELFNKGLEAIEKDGTKESIMKKFGFWLSEEEQNDDSVDDLTH